MARDDDSDEFEVLQDKPKGPKPRVTVLNMILIVLNMVTAVAFVFLMTMHFKKRQDWAFAVFMRDLEIQGLPLREEDEGQSGSRATLPRQVISGEELKAAHIARAGAKKGITEPFRDVDERLPHTVEPRNLTEDILKSYFGKDLGDVVVTLEDEVERIKKAFPKAVEEAAKAFTDKIAKIADDADRRPEIRKAVLPAAHSAKQIRALNTLIEKSEGDALLAVLKEGVERRMYLEFLTPLELFRPSTLDAKEDLDPDPEVDKREKRKIFLIGRSGDLDAFPLADLKKLFDKRLDAAIADTFDPDMYFGKEFKDKKRGSIEKRRDIGHVVLAVAHVHDPVGKMLFEKGLDRARKVLGHWEFADAVPPFTANLNLLREIVMANLIDDMRGVELALSSKGTKVLLPSESFVAKHEEIVTRINDHIRHLHSRQLMLKEMQAQNVIAKKEHAVHAKNLVDTIDKLNASRAETKRVQDELRELQRQLFEAQRVLGDGAEVILELERMLREEMKGKKTP